MSRLPMRATALLFLAAAPALAQTSPPGTDIYLADLTPRDGGLQVGRPVNLTGRKGYDNQPGFAPDGRTILYTSIREDGQADIYRFDLARHTSVRLTRTPESEYSPTMTPDGRSFSVIRVEADSTQRLWRFDLDGGAPRLILPAVEPVGYHAWADEPAVALFILGSPPTLQIADTRSGRAEVVAEDIGRSLHKIPGRRAISFVHRVSPEERWIKELDLETRRIRPLIRLPGRGEDYAWTPDGTLLMAEGAKLYRWDPRRDEAWREVADLSGAGLQEITRLAVSPQGDRLALVAVESR